MGLVRDFTCPHRRRLLHEFSRFYPETTELDPSKATMLVASLCFADGRGRVPLRAVTEHFAANATAEDAVIGATKLLALERTPRMEETPVPPPSPTFVSEWLERMGMKHLAQGFAAQKIDSIQKARRLDQASTLMCSRSWHPQSASRGGSNVHWCSSVRPIVKTTRNRSQSWLKQWTLLTWHDQRED